MYIFRSLDPEVSPHTVIDAYHAEMIAGKVKYLQTSNISGTKSQNLNVSHLVLQLPLPNPLKPGVKF